MEPSSAVWSEPWASLESGLRKCFNGFLHEGEELVRDRSVDHAMIERNRKISAGANGDCVLAVRAGQDLRPFFDCANPQDSYLRLVDDRRSHQRAKDAGIGNGERPPLNFL